MADFSFSNGALLAGGTTLAGVQLWAYKDESTAFATIIASGYFNEAADVLHKHNLIWVIGSDDQDWVKVTSENGVTPVTVEQTTGELDALAQGSIFVGNASNVPVALDAKSDGKILVGNGTTVASVAVSGDIGLTNAGVASITADSIINADVNSAAAIDFSKLAALTDGNILVGNGSNVATSVAMSGDATIDNAGAVTIANDAVTTVKILNSAVTTDKLDDGAVNGDKLSSQSVDGDHIAQSSPGNSQPTVPQMYIIDTAGGATANTDVADIGANLTVTRVDVILKGSGTAGDTIQLQTGAGSAVTEAIDVHLSDETLVSAETIDDALSVFSQGDTIRVAEIDGGGNDSPACRVLIYGYSHV